MVESVGPPRRARSAGPGTVGVHGGAEDRTSGSPVAPAIQQSATFHWAGPESGELLYTRYSNNPNQVAVGEKIAALEGMAAAVPLASGMAATSMTLLALVGTGDHVVASSQLYGATQGLLGTELPKRGVGTTFVDPVEGDWKGALRSDTRVLFFELPTNPTLRVFDPRPIVESAHARGIRVVCDATFASPINLRAGSLGIDAVIHSATKYLGGHADIIAGVVAGSRELIEEVNRLARLYGPSLDPNSAWLLDRGLRTLELRMLRHNENGEAIARFLERHPAVSRVVYPGLPSHPDHDVAASLLAGFGGMIGMVLKGGGEAADRLLGRLRLAVAAPSLGSVQTLVSQPRHTSHAALTRAEREAQGIPDGFVRISVGVENVDDLIADFEEALDELVG
ncbi:MAG TPA: aminotransferase class I/II-fold pyridoxal phosphate-dependent enzyme [Longimicrobiales bacterium]|nr:aminotransferase class I/II-fold pyridoxal phosphate-dependent enzyme [Longimicrobiales bacterium]